MMPEKINFTKARIEAVQPPTDKKRVVYYDLKTDGLALFVTATGKKAFYFYKWVEDAPGQLKLGAWPDLTVDQARKKAARCNADVANGINPFKEAKTKRGELTLHDLFEEVMERHLKPRRAAKTVAEYERQFKVHLQPWARKKLSNITRRDVLKLHSALGQESGPYLANRVLALLSMLFTKAHSWGHFSGDNPAKGVERFQERSRDRFLQPDEFPRFFKALNEEPNETVRDCLRMCLYTGARRTNVQMMRWEEVNLERQTWRIPDTKSGEALTVPLVPKAIEILQTRKEQADDSPWVFPGRTHDKHIVEVNSVWQGIIKRAGIPDLRMHDLRRSLGSWMAAQGASLTVIGKGLGHKNTSTTAIYSRLNIDPVRTAMEAATSAMLQASGEAEEPKNIVNMNKPNRS
ncbi:MAG: tyrosine-type recombinase/integrase [Chloroflexi bacterium]|nr:tyrosine-type recombinase/integrase [Chloroflexota bacterium]